ncbi:MAG: hypothetical protein HY727_00655 [Candidatus Rokubacteria bacterium]|nr:hypothetical protein [Candidatus Rokubacteria bacterium]
MADTASTQQLFDMWKKQVEEGAQAWARLVNQAPGAAADPFAFWRPVIEQGLQTWSRTVGQIPLTPDLMGQWKQLVDQWIDAWSRALAQAMGTEGFAQMLGRYLDQWLVAQGPLKRATDQSVENTLVALNLPSRTQVTGIAKQIVELEERIEGLEDTISTLLKRLDKEPR